MSKNIEVERKSWALVTSKAATDMSVFVALLWTEAFDDLCAAVDSRRKMEDVLRRGVEQQRVCRESLLARGSVRDFSVTGSKCGAGK